MAPARNFFTRWIYGEENPPLENRAAQRQQQMESRRRRHPSLTPSTQSQSQAPEPINTLTRWIFGNRSATVSPNRSQRRQQERAQRRSLSSTRRRSLSPSLPAQSSLSPCVATNGIWSQLSRMFAPLTSPRREQQTQDLVTPTRHPRLRQRSTLDTRTPTSQRRRAPRTGKPEASREQLPLVLGWAMTIHKSQGLTLSHVVLDLREKEMNVGIFYVGCSRVKSYKGLAFSLGPGWKK